MHLVRSVRAPGFPVVLLLASVVASCTAEPPSAAGSKATSASVFETEPVPPPKISGTSAVLPLQQMEGMNYPVVEVMLNGKGPFRFIVDTGASGQMVRITPQVAQSFGLTPVAKLDIGDGSAAQKRSVPVYNLGTVKLGTLTYSNVGAFARPLPKRFQIDGIIPFGFFRELLLTIDFGKQQLSVTRGSLPSANKSTIIDYERSPDEVYVPLNIGGRTYRAFVDTGNNAAPLFVTKEMLSTLPTAGEPKRAGGAVTVTQDVETYSVNLAAPVKLGSITLPVRQVEYPSAFPYAHLGSEAFRGLRITFDAKHYRMKIEPSR